mgnify:CR=1 FL=1
MSDRTLEQIEAELQRAQALAMQLNDNYLREAKTNENTFRMLSATSAAYEALMKVKEASSPLLQFAGADPAYIDAYNLAKERFEGTQRVLDKIAQEVIALHAAKPR